MKKCPRCEVVMSEVLKAGVAIDVCPQCMGIWLDKGELDKIIERSKSYDAENENNYRNEERGNTAPRFNDAHFERPDRRYDGYQGKVYYDKDGRPYKKKSSFGDILGDLFD